MWGDKDSDEDIEMDEAEFNKLFVESRDAREKEKKKAPAAEEDSTAAKI